MHKLDVQSIHINADWIVDGMSAMHSVAVRNTRKEFADAFLAFCIPPACTYVKSIVIVKDMYGKYIIIIYSYNKGTTENACF